MESEHAAKTEYLESGAFSPLLRPGALRLELSATATLATATAARAARPHEAPGSTAVGGPAGACNRERGESCRRRGREFEPAGRGAGAPAGGGRRTPGAPVGWQA